MGVWWVWGSHDTNAIRLIEDAEILNTKLGSIKAIHTYEIICYISKLTTNKLIKNLYNYMYYLSNNDISINPEWGKFKAFMDNLYGKYFIM